MLYLFHLALNDNVYEGYGELHGGSVGESMCKPDWACKGPNPDRLMEGNEYFDKDFPELTHLNSIALADAPAATAAPTAAASVADCPVEPKSLCDPSTFVEAPATFKATFETGVGSFVLEVLQILTMLR